MATLVLATCDLDKITKPTDASGVPSVVFTITGGSAVTLGGTLGLSVSSAADLTLTEQVWSSANPGVASVDSETGIVTGVTVGTATITARLLGLELDAGVAQTLVVTVGYKGIRITPVDSIEGLGLTKAVSARGLNASDVPVGSALSGVTWVSRDPTVFVVGGLSGQTVQAKKAGQARLVGTFNGLSDSVLVRVRPVAKRLVFPDTHFVADAVNANRTIVVRVDDMADSVIVAPTVTWSVADATVATIGATTGVIRFLKKDTTRVFATVDTVTRGLKVRVVQAVASVTKFAGDAQTDTVLHTLPVAPTVTVLDAGGTPVAGETVTFSVASGAGAVITDSVKVTDAQGKATLGSWTLGTVVGPQSITARAGTASATFTATAVPASPSKLVFAVHPFSAGVGAAIAPAIKVEVRDSLDNRVTSATGNVTLSFGTKPDPSAILGGTLTVAAVAGVATFGNITVSTSGAGFTLLANATGLAGAVSNSFDAFGVATKLGLLQQPVGSSAGGIMQEVRVAIQDAQGATVTNATDSVTIALGNPGSAVLNGTKKVKAENGIAYFNNLSVNTAGSGYTLIASAPSRTSVTSNTFTVSVVGTPTALAFSVQPSNGTAGQAISPAITVRVLDQNGAVVTNSTQQVALSLQSGQQLSGAIAVNAVAGEATFSNLIVNSAGTGLKLVAAAAGSATIAGTTSTAFDVSAGAASSLQFFQQPTHTPIGQVIAPAVTVRVTDAQGNLVASHPATPVALTLGNGCNASSLSGGGAVSTANGIATFSSLSISALGSSCLLTASGTGLASGTSEFFAAVAANGPVQLGFTTQPPATTTAGTSMNAGTVSFQDASGNASSTGTQNIQIRISVLSGPATDFSGSSQQSTSTSATFSGITFNTAGTYRLLATATGFDPDTSAEFEIVPGAASGLRFLTQPHQIVAGVPFSETITVAVVDNRGNTIPGATNSIEMRAFLNVSPFGAQRLNNNNQTSDTVQAVDGVAEFPGLSIYGAGTAISLNANTPGLGGAGTNNFAVLPGPLSALGFKSGPSTGQGFAAGSLLGTVEVQGQDSVGNVVSTFGNSVTLTLTGGNAEAVLNGTKTVAPVSGISTFSDLSIEQAGNGYQLSGSATGVSTVVSNSFRIDPGPTTQIGWIDQPQNTFANAPLNPSGQLPRVANLDQFGNFVSNGTGMRITIFNPTAGMTLRYDGGATTSLDINGQCTSNGCPPAEVPPELTISTDGTGIQLLATSHNTSFGTATSDPFDIAAFETGAQRKLAFITQPTNTSYGVTFTPMVQVAIQDRYGNSDPTATDQVGISLFQNPGGATLFASSNTAVNGVVSYPFMRLDKAGTGYQLAANSFGFSGVIDAGTFNVTAPGLVVQHQGVCDKTLSGNTIYFLEHCGSPGSIKSVSIYGGLVSTLVAGIANPQRIASDGTNVYWIESGVSNGQGALRKFPIANPASVVTMAQFLSNTRQDPGALQVDGTGVYFVAKHNTNSGATIKRVATTVGAPVTPTDLFEVTSCDFCMPWFAASAGQLFFLDVFENRIKRMPGAGGAVTTLTPATEGANTMQMVVSGTTLIYTQQTNLKTLSGATTATGEITPVPQIETGVNFRRWRLDGDFLYTDDGNVLKRYSTLNFGDVKTYGITLTGNNASLLTNETDVFVHADSNGHHLTKTAK
ncbi:MAG: hypothetical protein WD801_06775 [Gemmatimonadaceae bacterium]